MGTDQLTISLRFVETTLANDENSSDAEMANHLIQECPEVSADLIRELIKNERDIFFLEPLHLIDWDSYGIHNPYQ